MGTLLRSCVEEREPIELSFGVVSGVSGRMGISDGGTGAQGKGQFWGFFSPRSRPLISMAYFLTEKYSTHT